MHIHQYNCGSALESASPREYLWWNDGGKPVHLRIRQITLGWSSVATLTNVSPYYPVVYAVIP